MTIQEKICASNELQKYIRQQSIIVPNDYRGTLAPNVIENKVGYKIFADSGGPICPEKYFSEGNYRILAILKETRIKTLEEEESFLEGHDKAAEYCSCDYADMEPTYQNLAKLAYALVNNDTNFDDTKALIDCFRNNVCIVNINHFPNIKSAPTNDGWINSWAQLNMNLLQKQFELYEPSIVVGGHTITHLLREEQRTEDSGIILNQNVQYMLHDQIYDLFGSYFGKKNDTYYNQKQLLINTYHPSYYLFEKRIELILRIRNYWQENLTK